MGFLNVSHGARGAGTPSTPHRMRGADHAPAPRLVTAPGHVHRLAGLAVNILDAAGAHVNPGPLASSCGERVGLGGGGRHESAEHLAPRGKAPLLSATALAVLPLEGDSERGELAHGLLVTPEPREGERRDRREGGRSRTRTAPSGPTAR